MSLPNYDDALAIVGFNFRFSKARNNEELWDILLKSKDIRTKYSKEQLLENGEFPELIHNKHYVPYSVELEDMDCFDAKFFNYSERYAKILDPQNRLLLESAWHALEDAGYSPYDVGKKQLVGVFGGKNESQYFFDSIVGDYLSKNRILKEEQSHFSKSLEYITSYASDFTANWISYKLGLNGPALNIQTGCSTSFSVLAVAYQSLLTYQCDVALVVSSGLSISHGRGYLYKENGILSPDGQCRPFDIHANGTFTGNGIASLVVKRYEDALKDGDHIEAIILGIGISNDGNMKQDFMAPGLEGHVKAIEFAVLRAGLSPADIDYFEAHGTATKLGDSVEISTIKKVFAGDSKRKKPLIIGSVKSNLGHLYACAGFAGLIKVILSMKHRMIPPTANFTQINPYIDLNENEFCINSEPIIWESEGKPRRAGISSLGFGGTNIHVILEEPPMLNNIVKAPQKLKKQDVYLIFLSAMSSKQVNKIKDSWQPFVETSHHPENISYTSLVGRSHFKIRAASLIELNLEKNQYQLSDIKPSTVVDNPKMIWVYTGQGVMVSADYGKELYTCFKSYRDAIDSCKEILGIDLFNQIFAEDKFDNISELQKPSILQSRIFIIQYALSQLWFSFGMKPVCVVGHSLGEIAAACIAGYFDLKQALELVLARGKAFETIPSGQGAMLAVFSTETQLPNLPSGVVVAAYNAPEILVVSGEKDGIKKYQKECEERGIFTYPIDVTHAFHSPLMKNVVLSFKKLLRNFRACQPSIPFYSTLTGNYFEENMNFDYWCRQIISPTVFSSALNSAIDRNELTLALEIGPQSLLTSAVKGLELTFVPCTTKSSNLNKKEILISLGKLYEHGFIPTVENFIAENTKRVSLPGYPFEKTSYWIKCHSGSKKNVNHPTKNVFEVKEKANDLSKTEKEELYDLLREYWMDCLGNKDIRAGEDFFNLGGTSLIAIQIIEKINNDLGISIQIEAFMQARNLEKLTEIIYSKLTS